VPRLPRLSSASAPFFAAAAVGALQCVPLWAAPYPVMQDLPAHTEMSCQLLQIWRGDERFTSTLFVHGQPWANSLPTVVLAALLAIAPSLAMTKLLLSLALVALPLSLALLFRRFGASPWLALLCAPFSFDLAWSYGFFQFICAKPLLVLALWSAHRVVTSADPRPLVHAREGLALAALLVLTFITHSLVFLVALAACALVFLVCAPRARAWVRVWPLAFAAAVTAPFFVATRAPSRAPIAWREGALAHAWEDLGDLRAAASDAAPFVVVALVVVALLALAVRARARPTRGQLALALAAGVVFVGWLKGPVVLPQVSVVSPRLLSLACVLAIGALPLLDTARARGALVGAALVAICLQVAATTIAYRAFARDEMGDFDALLAKIPARARVATHYASPFSPYGRHNALWHWPKLACLTGASFTDDLFAYRKTAYVELRPERADFQLPPHRLRAEALQPYDALLVRGDVHALRDRADLALVGETGTWRLFTVRK
jgi:hypothetical protein